MWGIVRLALLLAGVQLALGVRFQIYEEYDRVGLIADIQASTTPEVCTNLKDYAKGHIGSVNTDTCLMVYEGVDCTSFSAKITEDSVNVDRNITSFRICTESLGGSTILTDMYSTAGDLVGEYRDVCGCQDLPTQVSTNLQKLNNYGNCVKVYELSNCRGQSKEIEAGMNADSENLRNLPYRVRSLSACGAKPACVKLQSTIYKFELLFPEDEPEGVKNVDLGTTTKIYNNGSATVTQEYFASKTIRQRFSVTLSKSVTTMDHSETEHTHKTESSSGWSFFGRGISTSISSTLRHAYSRTEESTNSTSETFESEEEKTFAVTQIFEVPPCVEYDVSSTLTILDNVEINYWLYARVTGSSSGFQLRADELEGHVEGMEFVENYDDYTAIFRSKHSMLANVGVDTWITGEGSYIEGCAVPESS